MIRSMTGYGTAEKHTEEYTIKVEIRSLNGKYLDLNLRMPKFLMSKEIELRSKIGSLVDRGSASVHINIIRHKTNENAIQINNALASEYYKKLKALSDQLSANDSDIFRIVTTMQDVIYQDDESLDMDMYNLVKETISDAFKQFDDFRKKEGEGLKIVLLEYAENIKNHIPTIASFEAERITNTKERLHKNLTKVLDDENFDKNRFEQELIYYLEKFDINEEKTRLANHCSHFADSLEKNPKGKSLNFIAQEMGREINTLGSKANHAEIQKLVIRMKEELEKIKEQALNIL